MADKVVSLKVVVDTASGTANVENLNEELRGTVEATEQTGKQSKKITTDMSGNFKNVANAIGSINPQLGFFIKSLEGAEGSIGGLTKVFGTLKGAIMATGIGALVIALGSLVTYFKRTEEGADFFAEKLAGIKSAINVLIDRFASFGKGIFQLFSGEFKKGWETLKGSLSGIGDEIARETKESMALARALDELEDKEIALIEVNARKEAQIAKLRLEAEDENKTNAEKIRLLKEAFKLENEISEGKISIAKEKARITAAEVKQGQQTADNLRKVAEANAEVIKLEAERDAGLRSLQKRINSLTPPITAHTDAMKKQIALYKEISGEVAKGEVTQKAVEQVGQLQTLIAGMPPKIAQSTAESLHIMASTFEAEYNFMSDGLGALAELVDSFEAKNEKAAERQFKVSKALRMTQAIIDTYAGASSAFTDTPGGIVIKSIAAGIATIAGLARVNAIKNTKFGETTAAPVQSASSGTSGGVQSQSTGLTVLTPQSVRSRKDTEPVKVYVTETDIRAASGRVSDIQSKAVVK